MWRVISGVVVLASIVWGFAVLGSPATQKLYKYDLVKINNLQEINNYITSFYAENGKLPENLENTGNIGYYPNFVDPQTNKPYEYIKKDALNYSLCAEFNKASDSRLDKLSTPSAYPYGGISGIHPAGRHCFEQKVNTNIYSKPIQIR
jgi:hypothetical protein